MTTPNEQTVEKNDVHALVESDGISNQASEIINPEVGLSDPYLLFKDTEHHDILGWIDEAEEQLTDLKLRKQLLESDFTELLSGYNTFIVGDKPISTIARTNLLDYFTYELLVPLQSIDLKKVDDYNTWQTKHFLVDYRVNNEKELIFNFKMNGIDERFKTSYLPLIEINTKEMSVQVSEKDVLELIRLWHVEKIFSRNQLSLINYDLNLLLAHFKTLGFTVAPNLLDNTLPLSTDLTSSVAINETILDQIFMTTMENEEYDFEKESAHEYTILLNQGQSVSVHLTEPANVLHIDSNARKRSILDFFTHYPFLVPLVVSE